MTTYWIDPTSGDDANDGTTKALAVETFTYLDGLLSNDDSVKIVDGTHDVSGQLGSTIFSQTGLTFDSESSNPTGCILDAGGGSMDFQLSDGVTFKNVTFNDYLQVSNKGVLGINESDATYTFSNLYFKEIDLPSAYQSCIYNSKKTDVTMNISGCAFINFKGDIGYTQGCVATQNSSGLTINMSNCVYYCDSTGVAQNLFGQRLDTTVDVNIKNLIVYTEATMSLYQTTAPWTGTFDIGYSDLYGVGGVTISTNLFTLGSGMIATDPLLVDPANLLFSLQQGSPCIDTGGV